MSTPTGTASRCFWRSSVSEPEAIAQDVAARTFSRTRWLTGASSLAVASLLSMLISAAVGLAVARTLGPAGFGRYSAVAVAVALLSAVVNFRLDLHLATALVNDAARDRDAHATVMAAAYSIAVPACLAAGAGFAVFLSGSTRLVALFGLAEIFLSPLLLLRIALHVQARHATLAAIIVVGRVLWAAMTAAVLLADPRQPLSWLFSVRALALLAEGLLLSRTARMPFLAWVGPGLRRHREIVQVLRRSLPLGLSGVAGTAYDRVDQLLLAGIRGVVETGIYGAGVRVAELLGAIGPVVQSVTLPGLAELHRRGDEREFDRGVLDALLLMAVPAGAVAAVMVGWGGDITAMLFGDAYRSVTSFVAVLAIAEWLTLVGVSYANAALAMHQRAILAYTTVVGAVVNVAGNLAFAWRYGLYAAAWSSLAAYLVASLLIPIATPALRRSLGCTVGASARLLAAILGAGMASRLLVGDVLPGALLAGLLYAVLVLALLRVDATRVLLWVRRELRERRACP